MTLEQRIEDRVPKGEKRGRFHHFEDEIVEKVIRPKIIEAIRLGQPRNKTELLERFRELTGYENCTLHTISEWMEKCGFRIERKMEITVEVEEDALPEGVKEIGSGPPRPSGGGPPLVRTPNHGGLARPF